VTTIPRKMVWSPGLSPSSRKSCIHVNLKCSSADQALHSFRFQAIVPISLYLSIEFVRTCQAAFIYFDKDIWHDKTDQATLARSWNLSDDLGQIEYIFSDKTGTLTQVCWLSSLKKRKRNSPYPSFLICPEFNDLQTMFDRRENIQWRFRIT